jgi:hypothetical protein
MISYVDFGFCPQLACGQAMDKVVEIMRKICWQSVVEGIYRPHLLHYIIYLIPFKSLSHSFYKSSINNFYTTLKTLPNRLEYPNESLPPHFTQHPPLPLPINI